MTKVYAPNKGFTGEIAGVAFVRGVGEIDAQNADRIDYFRRKGYQIGEPEENADTTDESNESKSLDEMTREELNKAAESWGIVGAASMSSKDDVRAAIESARRE